jgi:hypothetical protein
MRLWKLGVGTQWALRFGAHHRQHRAVNILGLDRGEAESAVSQHDRGNAVPTRNRQIRVPEDLRIGHSVGTRDMRDFFGGLGDRRLTDG